MIKKIKIEKVMIKDEKEITSKKDGKKYKLCEVIILSADDSAEYAGKWLKTSFFDYVDAKDAKKNKSGKSKAEYFQTQNEAKEVWLDVEERHYTNKEGVDAIAFEFKPLSKKEMEVLVKAGVIK